MKPRLWNWSDLQITDRNEAWSPDLESNSLLIHQHFLNCFTCSLSSNRLNNLGFKKVKLTNFSQPLECVICYTFLRAENNKQYFPKLLGPDPFWPWYITRLTEGIECPVRIVAMEYYSTMKRQWTSLKKSQEKKHGWLQIFVKKKWRYSV